MLRPPALYTRHAGLKWRLVQPATAAQAPTPQSALAVREAAASNRTDCWRMEPLLARMQVSQSHRRRPRFLSFCGAGGVGGVAWRGPAVKSCVLRRVCVCVQNYERQRFASMTTPSALEDPRSRQVRCERVCVAGAVAVAFCQPPSALEGPRSRQVRLGAWAL